MTGNIDFNYYNDGKVSVFELPYSNSKYSMVIVEPGSGTTLSNVSAALDSVQWQTWMTNLKTVKNSLSLPKFKFSYGVNLEDALTDLGLGIAFSDAADFSLINPSAGLKITQVEHKAFVEIDESGTIAAAATSVGIGVSVVAQPPPPINHPFIFAIREMSSGIILFEGVMNNPMLSGN